MTGSQAVRLVDAFYRAGSLVFGGGHVVLPLLQAQVVPPGWVSNDVFLAGYGAAQAVPGPLFTFSAYLGAVMGPQPNGFAGALLCLLAIFLPSFFLVIGTLPFWEALRGKPAAAGRAERGERRRRRHPARGLLQSGLHGSDHQACGFRARGRGLPFALHVEDAALARRAFERRGRRGAFALSGTCRGWASLIRWTFASG